MIAIVFALHLTGGAISGFARPHSPERFRL
jgi:hypothetical protein